LLNVVLGQTVIFTLNGRLSDIFGRRYFFIGGATFGLIGFVISGSAKNLSTIIGGVSQNAFSILQGPGSRQLTLC
jgi:MFS family permease